MTARPANGARIASALGAKSMPTMLILRGNSGSYQDEQGKAHYYDKGALHEGPAKDLATRKGYTPQVRDVRGDATPTSSNRRHCCSIRPQAYVDIGMRLSR